MDSKKPIERSTKTRIGDRSIYSLSRRYRNKQRKFFFNSSVLYVCAIVLSIIFLIQNLGNIARFVVHLPYNLGLISTEKAESRVLELALQNPPLRTDELKDIADIGKASIARSRARYLLAVDSIGQKQPNLAIEWLNNLEGEYPVMAVYVNLKRAKAYQIISNLQLPSNAEDKIVDNSTSDDKTKQSNSFTPQVFANSQNNSDSSLVFVSDNSDVRAVELWRVARLKAKENNLTEAIELSKTILSEYSDSEVTDAAAFWLGKWLQKQGQDKEAKEIFTSIVRNSPQSYYAWRAAVFLGWKVGDFSDLHRQNPQIMPIKRATLPTGSQALQELYQIGQDEDAIELWQNEFANTDKPSLSEQLTDGLLRIAKGDYESGIVEVSLLKKRNESGDKEQLKQLQKSLGYWQGLYPFPYQDSIVKYASKKQINPLLVLALMRQESRFQSQVISPSGAIGLMQLMPTTADWIARKLSLKNYDLTNPEDNIRLGTWYLQENLERHEDNTLLAVASYNAGVGNLYKWNPHDDRDLDEFVENIPFEETKKYVKEVFSNYWNYLQIYTKSIDNYLIKSTDNKPKENSL
jgi:soluble lytic murein transglycosylase-like protein